MNRDIWQESWAKNSCTVHLFFWLATNANIEDNDCDGLKIQRGQLLTSIRGLSKATGISEQSVRTALKQLCLTHHITQGVTQWVTQGLTHPLTHSGTLVTICNYDRYSGYFKEPNTPSNTPSNTGSNTHPNTAANNDIRNIEENKENKEVVVESVVAQPQQTPTTPKERKKRSSSAFVKPTFEECMAYAQEKGYQWNIERFFNYYESNGWRVGQNPMKNWKAAMRTWNTKEPQYSQPNLFPTTTNNNNNLINNNVIQNNYDTGTSGNAEYDIELAKMRKAGVINENTERGYKQAYRMRNQSETIMQREREQRLANGETQIGDCPELSELDIWMD